MDERELSGGLIEAIIEEIPCGVVLAEADGEVVSYNKKALEFLGIDELMLLRGNFYEALSSGPVSQAVGDMVKGKARRSSVQMDIGGRSVSLTAVKVGDGGERILFIVQDITRFQDLDRIKADFVSDVLHRLKTPLTTIKSGLSLLVSGRLGELKGEVREIVSISLSETNRLVLLLNNLRNLLLIESGQMERELDIGGYALQDILDKAVAAVQPLAADKAVEIMADPVPAGVRVRADFDYLVEVLAAILSNAVVFSQRSSEVKVSCREHDGNVSLVVLDKGIGIKPENLPRVAEKFFREDNEVTRSMDGNGLGLFIARSLLNLMGGEIRIESREGHGTRVEVVLAKER